MGVKQSCRWVAAGILLLALVLAGCSRAEAPKMAASEAGTGSVQTEHQSSPKAAVDPLKTDESDKYFSRGLGQYEEGQYPEAVRSFDQAIALDPNNYKVYTAKGIALCFAGDHQLGVALIQKTLEMQPDYLPACYDMAIACKLQKSYDQSLYWFGRTIQGDPSNTWSYYGIATIYADRGEYSNALEYLRKAIELDQSVREVAIRQSHFDGMRKLAEFQALVK